MRAGACTQDTIASWEIVQPVISVDLLSRVNLHEFAVYVSKAEFGYELVARNHETTKSGKAECALDWW